MTDTVPTIVLAVAALAALLVVALAALTGWREWIALQRLRIEGMRGAQTPLGPGARIELSDLRERVRKLEAIAAGVDL